MDASVSIIRPQLISSSRDSTPYSVLVRIFPSTEYPLVS